MAILSNNGGAINLPPDLLKDSSAPTLNTDLYEVVITDLEPNSVVPVQFAWVYPDKTVSEYSPSYELSTSDEATPNTPDFNISDVEWGNGFLKITWNGKDTTGAALTNIKQVNIWMRGGTFGATSVKTAHFFTGAGTKTVTLPSGTYYVKLQAETALGKLSAFSNEIQSNSFKKPAAVSGLIANFKADDGTTKTDTLRVNFTFDSTATTSTTSNAEASIFTIKLTANSKTNIYTLAVDKTKTSHNFYLEANKNKSDFGYPFAGQFVVEVFVVNTYGLASDSVTITSDAYVSPLDTPIITATAENMGYSVSYNSQTGKPFDQIYIYENTGSGWVQKAQATSNPVRIGTLETLSRQVKAIFYDQNGFATAESNVVTVQPTTSDGADSTPPSVPTVTAGTSTYNTIPITVSTADATTKGFNVRYKKSGDTLYSNYDLPYTGASTTSTIVGLVPNSTYLIGAAAYDQANNLSAYSTDISKATATVTVSTPTGLTVSAISYGLLASWTAPAAPVTPVYNYKIELYNSSNALLETQYSFSTNASFTGLIPSITYYVKVYTVDIYNGLSAAVQSSNLTLNSSGGTTDGLAPAASPTPVVNPLFAALEIKWTGLAFGTRTTSTNPDPVTYEVHVSTTSGFTPAAGTKALDTTGTFAIVKTLPGTSTALSYGTTYHVKLIAKDADGSAAAGTQASAITLAVDNGDLAADSVRANQIQAGAITSDKVTAGTLLVNKLFTVGGKTAVVTGATVTGGNIVYTTSGTHGFAASTAGLNSLATVTGLSPAAFNITDFRIDSVTTNTFTVTNSVSATGSSTGTGTVVAVGSAAIKIDSTGDGFNTPFKLYSGIGTYGNANTKFYMDSIGRFSIADKLYIDGSSATPTLVVNGTIQAQTGYFGGAITVDGNGGGMKIGPSAGGVGNDGIYLNTNAYWYKNGNFAIGAATGSSVITWNGTALTVTGAINASSGTITGDFRVTTGTITTGANSTTGQRVNISSTGLYAYDSNGVLSTSIIANTGTGLNTFTTTRGLLGNWTVDSTSIYNNGISITAPNAQGTTASKPSIIANRGAYYVGMQTPASTPAATDVVLWAGLSSDGSAATFKVTADGKLNATGASITGTITGSTFTSTNYANGDGIRIYSAAVGGTSPVRYYEEFDMQIGYASQLRLSANSSGTVIWGPSAGGAYMNMTNSGLLGLNAGTATGAWIVLSTAGYAYQAGGSGHSTLKAYRNIEASVLAPSLATGAAASSGYTLGEILVTY